MQKFAAGLSAKLAAWLLASFKPFLKHDSSIRRDDTKSQGLSFKVMDCSIFTDAEWIGLLAPQYKVVFLTLRLACCLLLTV